MIRTIQTMAFGVVLWASSAALGSPIRIDFVDDSSASTPGFDIRQSNAMSPISDSLRVGSSLPSNADGLGFLRITQASPAGAQSVVGFILTMPAFKLFNNGATGNGLDTYVLSFASGNSNSSGWTQSGGGFAIYDGMDTLLAHPLLTADLNLNDRLLFAVGGSGAIEPSADLNLTNVQTRNTGGTIDTLRDFAQLAAAGGGASFVTSLSSASSSQSISQRILAGAQVNGSASGWIQAVPEPATLFLLAMGALIASRRKVNG